MKHTIVASALMAAMVPLNAQSRGPEAEAEAFRQRLLDAFARGDRQAVAGMVRYRLVVDAGGIRIPVINQPALVKMWDAVFPPAVRCVIEQSAIPKAGSPPPKYVMRPDAGGVTFGNGWIRAERGPGGMKISQMTLPPGYGSATPGKPRQVLFRWGKGRTKYAGSLAADNVDVYLVQARQGDLLNAQLERVHADRASLRVVQTNGKRVLATTSSSGQDPRRGWAGALPESGEYRVEVVRGGAYCDPPVTYQLAISLE
jgi:hypothetical protein